MFHNTCKCRITDTISFGIVNIDGNICSRKCSCVKICCFLAMRSEILHSNRGVWHCVSAKRICASLLMHRHSFSASWFEIFNRTGTTEGMGDVFLLTSERRLEYQRTNAALGFVPRNTHYVASLKIALIQEWYSRCPNTMVSVVFRKFQLFRNWVHEIS